MVKNYKVITLCGSTRFKDEFLKVQKDLTLQGNIVISVGLFGHSGDSEVWENMDEGTLTKTKEMLDDMHKRKIDMADEIFVINKNGYIYFQNGKETGDYFYDDYLSSVSTNSDKEKLIDMIMMRLLRKETNLMKTS